MRARLVTRFDVCTGCRVCELVCSFVKEGAFNPRYARLRIEAAAAGLYQQPVVCIQCDNPACMRVCPTGAIYRDSLTQAVILNQDKCHNCGLCVQYCPIAMVQVYPGASKPSKCDHCEGEPACVAFCPTGALVFVDIPEATP